MDLLTEYPRLFHKLSRRYGEDAAQDTLVKAWVRGFKPDDRYLSVMAKHRLRRLGENKVAQEVPVDPYILVGLENIYVTPPSQEHWAEVREVAQKAPEAILDAFGVKRMSKLHRWRLRGALVGEERWGN